MQGKMIENLMYSIKKLGHFSLEMRTCEEV